MALILVRWYAPVGTSLTGEFEGLKSRFFPFKIFHFKSSRPQDRVIITFYLGICWWRYFWFIFGSKGRRNQSSFRRETKKASGCPRCPESSWTPRRYNGRITDCFLKQEWIKTVIFIYFHTLNFFLFHL